MARLRAPGLVVLGFFASATVGFLVNRFGPGAIETITNQPPLRFVVGGDKTAYVNGTPIGIGFALTADRSHGLLPEISSCEEVRRWALARGGVDAGATYLTVAIEGLNTSPVLIQDIRAQVVSRDPPLTDTTASCPQEGVSAVIGLGFDLDDEPAVARVRLQDGSLGDPYFREVNITVAKGEVLTVALVATTDECRCRWRIHIHAVVEGEERTFVLDQDGQPFVTNAWPNQPRQELYWLAGLENDPFVRCPGPHRWCDVAP